MSHPDDVIEWVEEAAPAAPLLAHPPWKVAVIDDDAAVHEGTRFALYDYELNGQTIEILSAFSASEGRELLARHPDIAVILLDVVMETETAGLDLVDHIRRELENETVRIILRTGQPGQAPERRVILDYDINDYKAKTELTADKLFTSLTAALRSHTQLQRMHETRRGLEIIIEAAPTLFDMHSMQRLAEGVLLQLASIIEVDCAGILVLRDDETAGRHFSVLAGSGCYSCFVAGPTAQALDADFHDVVRLAFERRAHEFVDRRSVLFIATGSGREVVVVLDSSGQLSATSRSLVEVFCSRLAIAFDNIMLYGRLQDANLTLEQRVAQRTIDLKTANRRLTAQTSELRKANRFKSEILGTIAHDLKNPLGVIMGRSEMLADMLSLTPVPTEPIRLQVGHVRESAKRLTTMIDTLIKDAMSDALDIRVRGEPVDLALLAAEVVEANRTLAERKQQMLTIVGPETVLACGDQDRLWEAFDNVVSNAVKYTPSGGRIRVELEVGPETAILRVRDDGPGLLPEDLGRVFGRFQRLSAKPTAGESSTGLGLSIAKRIVDLHRGTITAASDGPGQGAVFTIDLPTGSA